MTFEFTEYLKADLHIFGQALDDDSDATVLQYKADGN